MKKFSAEENKLNPPALSAPGRCCPLPPAPGVALSPAPGGGGTVPCATPGRSAGGGRQGPLWPCRGQAPPPRRGPAPRSAHGGARARPRARAARGGGGARAVRPERHRRLLRGARGRGHRELPPGARPPRPRRRRLPRLHRNPPRETPRVPCQAAGAAAGGPRDTGAPRGGRRGGRAAAGQHPPRPAHPPRRRPRRLPRHLGAAGWARGAGRGAAGHGAAGAGGGDGPAPGSRHLLLEDARPLGVRLPPRAEPGATAAPPRRRLPAAALRREPRAAAGQDAAGREGGERLRVAGAAGAAAHRRPGRGRGHPARCRQHHGAARRLGPRHRGPSRRLPGRRRGRRRAGQRRHQVRPPALAGGGRGAGRALGRHRAAPGAARCGPRNKAASRWVPARFPAPRLREKRSGEGTRAEAKAGLAPLQTRGGRARLRSRDESEVKAQISSFSAFTTLLHRNIDCGYKK